MSLLLARVIPSNRTLQFLQLKDIHPGSPCGKNSVITVKNSRSKIGYKKPENLEIGALTIGTLTKKGTMDR